MNQAVQKVLALLKKTVSRILSRRRVPTLRNECWGKAHPDKRFLVIRRNDWSAGLFSYYVTTLGWIWYAEQHGMIPVVDMMHYKNIYLSWLEVRRKNAWEFFFRQPSGYSLKDIRHAKNITIATGVDETCRLPCSAFVKSEKLSKLRAFAQSHIQIAPSLPANDLLEQALAGGGVLGVLARGTDYVTLHPKGSSVQPDAAMIIEKVRAFLAHNETSAIYLVSEDAGVRKAFSDAFGSRVIFPAQKPLDYAGGLLSQNKSIRTNRRQTGLEYLKAIVDLSRCANFIGSPANGSAAAMLMTKGFGHSYVFDLGKY